MQSWIFYNCSRDYWTSHVVQVKRTFGQFSARWDFIPSRPRIWPWKLQPKKQVKIRASHWSKWACAFSYLKVVLQCEQANLVSFSTFSTNVLTLAAYSGLLQAGQDLFVYYHVRRHELQFSMLQVWHSFGSIATFKQILHAKWSSRGPRACLGSIEKVDPGFWDSLASKLSIWFVSTMNLVCSTISK